MKTSKTEPTPDTGPKWQTTPVANLVRNATSGLYYARPRIGGKLIWKSLKTDRLSVAQLRLGDFLKEQRHNAEAVQANTRGKMTFGQALAIYQERLKADVALKDRSKIYREERLAALLKSWPELAETDVRRISKSDCLHWAGGFAKHASPSTYNNTVGTLKLVIEVAVEAGARYDNPARHIKRMRVRQKLLKLPSHDEFLRLVETIRRNDGGWNHRCAHMVEFLAYSGCRKGEAVRVNGRDCDLEKGEITVLGDPATGTKNWSIRRVPMIPDMRALLERLRLERGEREFLRAPVLEIHECQGAINSACKKLGVERFTHHDLRHLFATRCIESGVDIPTLSRWLGHKDGGALAMKTYGHLRDQHSATMAKKVLFRRADEVTEAQVTTPEIGRASEESRRAVSAAKAKYAYPWWASADPMEAFWGQANEPVQIIPRETFREYAVKAMGRDVFSQELEDKEALALEFVARTDKATVSKLNETVLPHQNKQLSD